MYFLLVACAPAPYRRAGSVSDAATVNRVAASSSRVRARRVGAVAAWEGRAYSSSFFSSSGRFPEPLKYHSPSSSIPYTNPPSIPAPCTMVFGFCWMKSGVAACVQSTSEKHHEYRFGADGCNSFADRHDGSADDHPGGLTRRRAASRDRQCAAGSKCSGSTKDECDSTHNSCLTMQSRPARSCARAAVI